VKTPQRSAGRTLALLWVLVTLTNPPNYPTLSPWSTVRPDARWNVHCPSCGLWAAVLGLARPRVLPLCRNGHETVLVKRNQ
jgi:hypothetical protein